MTRPAHKPILSATARFLAGRVVAQLSRRGQTLALAESCTGGLVSAFLVAVPGASAVLAEGLVTYSNEAKTRRLGVLPQTLTASGAVSAACVREMAAGLRAGSGATWAAAVSGIAGPGGGSPDKPVGTVWIGLEGPDTSVVLSPVYRGGREAVRLQTLIDVYRLLLNSLQKGDCDHVG